MLVVFSDLHFEEEASNNIPGDDTHNPIVFSRNLPGKVFRSFITHLANEANRNGARRLDLVFAGDIFDIHRTGLWFRQNPAGLRPYVNNSQVSGDLETLLLKVLDAIQQAKGVNEALEAFRLLAAGKYWDGVELDFPVEVQLHFIPGNHDRLANATPAIRQNIRQALGMSLSGDPFPRMLLFPEEFTIVRHGHEYDRYNFSHDYSKAETIPLMVPDNYYDAAPFGDFATVDIASRSPHLFRKVHGEGKIIADPILRAVYLRLLEFDDLRPQSALFNYLLHMPEAQVDPVTVWKVIEPVIYELLEDIHKDPFLKTWLEKMDSKWKLDVIDVIQTTLSLRPWRLTGIPLGLAQFISNSAVSHVKESVGPHIYAAREEAIQQGDYHFLIAGHTHNPATELIASDVKGERYYIDTGTWRNRVPATPDFKSFGRLKALTYTILYGPDEDQGDPPVPNKVASLDFWSGVTQRWISP
jgi:UDP-2,3-diacylglucosamine pyrophosphatase LpxH